MEEFKVIETQEQLDAIIGDRLKRDRESQAKKYEGFVSPDDFKKKCDEYEATIKGLNKTVEDGKKLAGEVDGYKATIKKYETDSVKTKIAHEMGLPYELAGRLSGETEDDIRKDAESLAKLVVKKSAPPLRSDEPDTVDSTRAEMKGMLDQLKGE